jgi:YHS domain-containing protein
MDGYCPVTLREKWKWQRGSADFSASHGGLTYHLVSEEAQAQFREDPEAFAPVLSGNDAVIWCDDERLVPGHREHGVTYRDRVFLFSTEQSLRKFGSNPNRYTSSLGFPPRPTISIARLRDKAGLFEIETFVRVLGLPAVTFGFRINVPADTLKAAFSPAEPTAEPNESPSN